MPIFLRKIEPRAHGTAPSGSRYILHHYLQAVALVLACMTALVTAARSVEFPRDIDGDVSDIAINVNVLTIIQTIISCRFCSVCSEDVICRQSDSETFVL